MNPATHSLVSPPCRICKNAKDNRTHFAREMMFGLRDVFPYLECSRCGCLQLLEIPSNMSRYYPAHYYSFKQHGRAKQWLRHQWSAYAFGRFSMSGWLCSELFFANKAMVAVRRLNPKKDSRILDVGCGAGHLLLDLQHLGFKNLTGVDPFIERDIEYAGGITVHKKPFEQFKGEYDIVMLHHSFEHMDSPADIMKALKGMLATSGIIILRIPVASSYGWKHFGVNWFNLDAPRHFFLHSDKSIDLLAKESGLSVKKVIHEADEGLFEGSEAYEKNIAVSDPGFPSATALGRILRYGTVRRLRRKADELNKSRQADQVCFELEHAGGLSAQQR